ncbi:MAG: tyrosine-type recombinase/integrase [Gammaproteobacteria bacterium]|nr:tyrosine-type recombinase/integrase [Gammaproteobacteria bacterium]
MRDNNNNVVSIDQRSFLGAYSGRTKRRINHATSPALLTARQIERLIKAAQQIGNHGMRNATFMLMAYRHGLRIDELINLKWTHIDLDAGTLQVSRLKNGQQTVHPLTQQEVRHLASLKQLYPDAEYVFITAAKTPLNTSVIHKMVKRAGAEAGLSSTLHPGILQAGGGFQLTINRPH